MHKATSIGKGFPLFTLIFIVQIYCLAQGKTTREDKGSAKLYQDAIIDGYKFYVKKDVLPDDYKNDTLSLFFDLGWNKCDKVNSSVYTVAYPYKGTWICEDYSVSEKHLLHYIIFADKKLTNMNGSFYKFDSNGKIRIMGKYANNKREGVWQEYGEEGSLRDSCYYRNEMPVGTCYSVYASGSKARVAMFDNQNSH